MEHRVTAAVIVFQIEGDSIFALSDSFGLAENANNDCVAMLGRRVFRYTVECDAPVVETLWFADIETRRGVTSVVAQQIAKYTARLAAETMRTAKRFASMAANGLEGGGGKRDDGGEEDEDKEKIEDCHWAYSPMQSTLQRRVYRSKIVWRRDAAGPKTKHFRQGLFLIGGGRVIDPPLRSQRQNGLADFVADGFGLREEIEIIGAARFGIGAGHIESAEGMGADHGSGAFAIDVEIADMEFVLGALDFFGRLGVNRAGEAVVGVVGDGQRVVVIF